MADEKYSRNNPTLKRILQEVKEMQSNPSDDFMSLPLRGLQGTEFEGGIYHGRIQSLLTSIFHVVNIWTALVALIAFMHRSPNGWITQRRIGVEEIRMLSLKPSHVMLNSHPKMLVQFKSAMKRRDDGPSIAHVAVAEASERGQPRQQMFTWAAVGLTIAIFSSAEEVLQIKRFWCHFHGRVLKATVDPLAGQGTTF